MAEVPASPEPARRKRGMGSLLVAVALIAAAAGGAFVMLQGDDDKKDSATTSGGEIFLEPVSYRTPDAFTLNLDRHNAASSSTTAPVLPTLPPPTVDSSTSTTVAAVRSVQGTSPGLYGGTRNNAACDSEQLITFLQGNPDKAAAWAGVIGITTAAIPDYVRSLTPVLLQRDTRVTNHGFRNGRATSLQSVLQAGTAVLVDDLGVPRVKCACGNPLGEPTAISGPATYTGNAWPTFAPANVIVVAPAPEPVTSIILVDVAGGDPFTRPVGTLGTDDAVVTTDSVCDLYPESDGCGTTVTTVPGEPELGTGDVQITLRWSSTADLDLAVTDPTGAYIDFDNRVSPSGGQLDVDSNGGCEGATSTPVENIFWPLGAAPDGEYLISVHYFDVCLGGEGPQPFTLSFALGGVGVPVLPASFDAAGGDVQVQLVVDHGAVTAVAAAQEDTVVSDVLNPGESREYRSSKGPGYTPPEVTEPPTSEAPTPDAPTTPPDEGTVTQPDCSQFEEGSPMRILCEHDPTTNDVSGEDGGSLPAPAD